MNIWIHNLYEIISLLDCLLDFKEEISSVELSISLCFFMNCMSFIALNTV
jgi:hypothetical protein